MDNAFRMPISPRQCETILTLAHVYKLAPTEVFDRAIHALQIRTLHKKKEADDMADELFAKARIAAET